MNAPDQPEQNIETSENDENELLRRKIARKSRRSSIPEIVGVCLKYFGVTCVL